MDKIEQAILDFICWLSFLDEEEITGNQAAFQM